MRYTPGFLRLPDIEPDLEEYNRWRNRLAKAQTERRVPEPERKVQEEIVEALEKVLPKEALRFDEPPKTFEDKVSSRLDELEAGQKLILEEMKKANAPKGYSDRLKDSVSFNVGVAGFSVNLIKLFFGK